MKKTIFKSPAAAISYIKQQASLHIVSNIASYVIDDPAFIVCSGSSKPEQHHYGDGGLVIHTAEVILLCDQINSCYSYAISGKELFLAALFHDTGKMWDYVKINGNWQGTSHKRKIHHISRSALHWNSTVSKFSNIDFDPDDILHAILAHHGLREWGSPVSPHTKLAWVLHLCDNLSARMNDADTMDRRL